MPTDKDLFYSRLKSQKEESQTDVKAPFFCDLLISEKCNLQCKTCYFWKNGLKEELSIEECKHFVSSLKVLVKTPFEINLGGGEPLLKKGIPDLIRYCVNQGAQPTISTNATLIDAAMAKELAESGLHRLSLSLKSLNEDTHDFLTGVKGSYKRFMQAVEHLKKYWQRGNLNIHVTLQEQNIDEILDIVEWVNLDPFFTGISFQALAQPFRTNSVDRWYAESEYSYLWPKDSTKVSSVIDKLIKYKIAGYRILNPLPQLVIYKRYYNEPGAFARIHKCNFGDYIFNVNVLGLVHLCCFMDPIGNIKHKPIADIWNSPEAKDTRQKMYRCQKSCNNIVNCYFQEEGDETQNEVKIILDKMRQAIDDKTNSKAAQTPSNSLTSCDILLTARCMLKCKMCYLWNRRRELEELSIDEWKGLVTSLQKFTGSGPMRLHFGGGEPFFKEGILDLIRFSVDKGFKTIATSNGFLIDEKMARIISDAGLGHITLSLDSLKPNIHDYLRGAVGSHERVVNAIEYLYRLQKKPSIGINCIISNINLEEIVPLAHWVSTNEKISGIIFQAVIQPYETPPDHEWYKNESFSELWPNDMRKLEYVLEQLMALKEKGNYKISNPVAQLKAFKTYFKNPLELIKKMRCPMNNSSLLVNWLGQVYFCGLLQPIGDIRGLTLDEIFMSRMAEDRWTEMNACRRNCNNKVNCFFEEEAIIQDD